MNRNPTPPDVAPHPEAAENRQRGGNLFVGVREYVLDQDTLHFGRAKVTVDVVLARGPFTHWYAPFVHSEIVGDLAKLRAGTPSQILEFAATYGTLGFSSLVGVNVLTNAFHVDRTTGERSAGGDPLPWIRAHASGAYICLAITEALNTRASKPTLMALLERIKGQPWGDGFDTRSVDVAWTVAWVKHRGGDPTPAHLARCIRNDIINSNVSRISRYLDTDDKGKDRSYFRWHALIDVVYWHLANLVDGGTVKRCEAEGCPGLFIQRDPRQRYCPKRWRQQESSCAARQRQRDYRPGAEQKTTRPSRRRGRS